MIRSLGVALTSLLLFLAFAEGAVRLAGVEVEAKQSTGFVWERLGQLYTMRPNGDWILPGSNKLVRVNQLGLRGGKIGDKGEWERILLLGDSVSFGYGVAEKWSLPNQIQRRLHREGRPVEVINAGVPGWCARQHRLFLEQHGAWLAPDLVLATVVLNDIPELLQGLSELEASIDLANAMSWMAQRSALAATARRMLAAGENPFARVRFIRELTQDPDSPLAKEGMAKELEELTALADAAQEVGASFGLVLLPFRFQVKESGTERPQEQIRAFAQASGIPVLDILPLLREFPSVDVFTDKVHFSRLGNEVVSGWIARWITDEGFLEDAARPPSPGSSEGRPSGERKDPA